MINAMHKSFSFTLFSHSMTFLVSAERQIRRQQLFSSWDVANEALSPTNRHIRLHPKGLYGLLCVEGILVGRFWLRMTRMLFEASLFLLSETLYYTEHLQQTLFVLLDYKCMLQPNISFLAVRISWRFQSFACWEQCGRCASFHIYNHQIYCAQSETNQDFHTSVCFTLLWTRAAETECLEDRTSLHKGLSSTQWILNSDWSEKSFGLLNILDNF